MARNHDQVILNKYQFWAKGIIRMFSKSNLFGRIKFLPLKVLALEKGRRRRKRHKNIKNEIMMEREVLLRLTHPNVVKLYHTFGDACALYYLLIIRTIWRNYGA